MNERDLLLNFESLGDNCEFGLLQRRCDAEPLGFFRFNWATLDALLRVLKTEFADVGNPEKTEVIVNRHGSGEFMVEMPEYGFSVHTGLFESKISIDQVRRQQIKVQAFLRDKIIADLTSGDKIFVRKGADSTSLSDAKRLHEALLRYGNCTLLWVVPEDEAHPAGSVEVLERSLLKGYIDRFAPGSEAVDLSACWIDICRNAHALAVSGCGIGTVIHPGRRRQTTNLLRREHLDKALGWSGPWVAPGIRSQPAKFAPPPEARDSKVTEYKLDLETTPATAVIGGSRIPVGLAAETPYVASAFVFVPSEADLDCVDVVISGESAIQRVTANPKLRNAWQRIWTGFRLPSGRRAAAPGLFVVGRPGARLYAAGWQFEIGHVPTAYVANTAGGLRRN